MKESGESEENIFEMQTKAQEIVSLLKLDKISEVMKKDDENGDILNAIEWRGKTIPISNASLKVSLNKVHKLFENMHDCAKCETNKDKKQFTKFIEACDNAIGIIEGDLLKLKNMSTGNQDGQRKLELEGLSGFVQHKKLHFLLTRDEIAIERFCASEVPSNIEGQIKYYEQISRMYDALLHYAQEISALPGGSEDDDFTATANAHELRLDAQRCYHIGCIYAVKQKVSLFCFCESC